MDAVDKAATLLFRQLANPLEVLSPISTAGDEDGETLAVEEISCLVRLQEGAHRHAHRPPPRGRADADQVIIPCSYLVGSPDIPGGTERLGGEHAEKVGPDLPHRESRESLGVARIG